VFTYYLKDALKTQEEIRRKKEKEQIDKKQRVSFPGWDKVEQERRQDAPQIWLTVNDDAGDVVRRVEGLNKKGFNRIAWDLRYPATDAVSGVDDRGDNYIGAMVAPGDYTVTLSKQVDGQITNLSESILFTVEKSYEGALASADPEETAAFWKETEKLNRSTTAATRALEKALQRVNQLQDMLKRTPAAPGNLDNELYQLEQALLALDEQLNGNRSKRQVGESRKPTISRRQNAASNGTFSSTYGPTPNLRRSLEIAATEFKELKKELEKILDQELPRVEQALRDAGAPWIEGQAIPEY
jgi:hypothetical protein